ncbi:MAG: hypothetical protein J6S85_11985 [Methanobrevibacter sp.]|nr:hypothetical protein [Methanobrevibacter sp.]
MEHLNKYFYIGFLFLIICILISSVSALEIDYDLELNVFHGVTDQDGWDDFHMYVPSDSNFTLEDNSSGRVRNSFGEGKISTFINNGDYEYEVQGMKFVEDFSENGAIINESFTNLIENATQIVNLDKVTIYEYNRVDFRYGAFIVNDDMDKGLFIYGDDLDLIEDMVETVQLH